MEYPSFLAIRNSRFGKGLFTTRAIAADTVLCRVTGRQLTFQQTINLAERESHCLQIDQHKYILCDPPFLYSNHSCAPNSKLNAQLQLVALRDLQKGEEILWDYSTSMLERHWTMTCACNAPQCRKVITDFDLLPQSLQTFYIEKRMVLPFIVAHLQTFSKDHVHRA